MIRFSSSQSRLSHRTARSPRKSSAVNSHAFRPLSLGSRAAKSSSTLLPQLLVCSAARLKTAYRRPPPRAPPRSTTAQLPPACRGNPMGSARAEPPRRPRPPGVTCRGSMRPGLPHDRRTVSTSPTAFHPDECVCREHREPPAAALRRPARTTAPACPSRGGWCRRDPRTDRSPPRTPVPRGPAATRAWLSARTTSSSELRYPHHLRQVRRPRREAFARRRSRPRTCPPGAAVLLRLAATRCAAPTAPTTPPITTFRPGSPAPAKSTS